MTSIHRPPTPEPEEPTPAEYIRVQLAESGERERLKSLLRHRLEECGWKDEVRALARELMRSHEDGAMTVDELVLANSEVAAYSLASPGAPPRVTRIEEGAPVIAVRASPDGRMLALQRTPAFLEVVDTGSGRMLVAAPARRGAPLVGFFWTAAPGADLVMATAAGLELCTLAPGGQALSLRSQLAHPVRWVRYDHGTRLALLGTGEQGLWLQGYQFAAEGLVKLPPFQIAASTPGATPAPPAASRLDPAAVRLLALYGRAYCAFLDRPGRRVLLYRLFRDAVVLERSYEAGAPDCELGVADSLLLLHQPAARRVALLDVAAPPGQLAPPLPLALDPAPSGTRADPGSWRYCLPNLVLDAGAGVGWEARVDLTALAAASRDPAALVGLLQRRRPAAHTRVDLKALTLAALRGVLVERAPLGQVRAVFDAATAAFAEAAALAPPPPQPGQPLSPGAIAAAARPVVGPADVEADVLRWLHDEEAVPAPYLQAAADAYAAAAEAHGVAVPASLHLLTLDVALQQGHALQAAAMLAAHPGAASAEAAERLEALAEAGGLAGGARLVDGVRARLGLHTLRCRALLRQGRVVRALRLARRHQVESLPPAAFLHAAAESGDLGVFFATYRFCHESVRPPLPDYATQAAAEKPKGKTKGKAKDASDSPYKDTVNLPKTSFNMRANSAQREPELQRFWETHRVYQQLLETNQGDEFTLHDGPPYANGDTHLGHALNKILKSFIVQYQLLRGRRARFVPGWDCHGLPIELKVLQALSDEQRRALSPLQLRRKARDFALKTVKAQRAQFQRYGVWGDWEAPYLTQDPVYEAAQLRVFARLVAGGHVYHGRKPVHWSPSSATALAEAELEYPEGHTSRSVYVAMPLVATGEGVPAELREALGGAALAIWTTTAWTLPANLAVAVNERLRYALVEAEGGAAAGWAARRLVVAEDLVGALAAKLSTQLRVVGALTGGQLAGCRYRHPLLEREGPVVVGGEYITTESGTGLVHTAPGHGQEDYQVGLRNGLELLSPVDDKGVFTAEAGPFAGLPVLTEGTAAVIKGLVSARLLLLEERYAHKYPYDWRTKQPTIFRATDQWFVSIEGFKAAAEAAAAGVAWVPASGAKRMQSMLQGRSDWCISRQRAWGLPIPVLYYTDTGLPLMTEETITHMADVVAAKGSDAFWTAPLEELLPERLRDQAPRLEKKLETLDVWFDSGSSWAGVVEARPGLRFPADLYLEGSDQHRGWFQSSLLTAVAARGCAPYRAVLTHGFALDEKGIKMSKSLGNVVDPRSIVDGGPDKKAQPALGADVLRLWVASVDYSGDVLMGPNILSQVADVYRKLRFTLRFLLGNLPDFDPAAHALPHADLPAVDRFTLAQFAALLDDAAAAYDGYQFVRVYQAVQRFAVADLSNWYLDVAKDRLYVRAAGSADRRACQTVLHALLQGLLPLLAPLVPHLAEDAWQSLPWTPPTTSVFQAGWFSPPEAWHSLPADTLAVFGALLALRGEVNQVLEAARRAGFLGSGLEARVLLHVERSDLAAGLQRLQQAHNGADPLRYIFIVSQVDLVASAAAAAQADHSAATDVEGLGAVTVGVSRALGAKCQRCWNYSTELIHHRMVYCTQCKDEVETETDDTNGYTCCTRCGRVLDEVAFSTEVTFTKGAGGESTVNGHFVSDAAASRGLGRISGGRLFGYQLDSHEKALSRGRAEVLQLVDRLRIHPREDSADSAARLYALALQKNFTRGRRTAQVAAACLYIICRQELKPFMLIDFSDALQLNVFLLGAVFMSLCKALHMEELPMFQRPVDPSLYMNRFADRLGFGKKMGAVVSTALQLVASMKRDWMQTGRRPSGICGAALFLAAHIHGFEKSKRDVMAVVHIGEATLSRRVSEFASTPSAELSSKDFEERGRELEAAESRALEAYAIAAEELSDGRPSCSHIKQGKGTAHFARGMCRACFEEFLRVSGGYTAGANPPAFTRGIQRELLAFVKEAEEGEPQLALTGGEDEDLESQMDAALLGNELQVYAQALVPAVVAGPAQPRKQPPADKMAQATAAAPAEPAAADEELSDLEDDEAAAYLHQPEEVALRKVIWEELNREYTEQQDAKQRAADAAAAKVAADAQAREVEAGAEGQTRKRGRGRPLGSKSKPRPEEDLEPAGTPQEAFQRMLDRKKLSSKINYQNLDGLFSAGDLGVPKRRRAEEGADAAPAAGRPLGGGRELGALRGGAGGASGGGLGTLRPVSARR
ncbi:hypothetical protein WJX81_006819 [Elliptochloris bilobata]|uniref:isoleucine--tRNA ligase n=1 Tax=Elliptochloris bilobata TaxID=381761 RepID=A0AAW1RN19_9CHLO